MGASSIRGSLADRRLRAARRLWDEAEPTQGSLVEVYLAERGLALDALPSDLRFADLPAAIPAAAAGQR